MKKKTIALLLVLMMVFGVTCGGTIAYLTSQTQTVTNTFTVGKVGITMVESDVNVYGEQLNDAGQTKAEFDEDPDKGDDAKWEVATVTDGNEYKLIPGHKYTKDPTITVDSDSEKAWLFVKLENGLKDIEKDDNTTIAKQMEANWTEVEPNVYAYKTEVKANDKITVFSTFTLDEEAAVADYAKAQIVITAYAVQADNFETAADAWKDAPTDWTTK